MAEGKNHVKTPKEEDGQRESDRSRNHSNNDPDKKGKEVAKGGQKSQSRGHSKNRSSSKSKGTTAAPQQSAGAQPNGGGLGRENQKTVEQETLREQLQKLVSTKLANGKGELDHAGLLALEALSKLPAGPTGEQSAAVGASGGGAAAGAGVGLTRSRSVLPPGIETLPKFSGKDPSQLTDILNRFHSLVIAALPGATPAQQNKALNRDVVFVLEGSALKFFNSLKAGQIDWEPIPPTPDSQQGQQGQQPGKPPFRPPSTWSKVSEAFHDHYLPADGIARTSETLFSLSQAAGETVPSLAQRQLGLTHHLNRLIEAHGGQTTFWEAITIRLFERALRADLRRLQHAEPPCLTFQESVDRAERNATGLLSTNKHSNKGADGRDGGESDAGGLAQGNNGAVSHEKGAEEEPSARLRSSPPVANKISVAVPPLRRDGVAVPENGEANGAAGGRQTRPQPPRETSSAVKGRPAPAAREDLSPGHMEDPFDDADEGVSSHDGARSAAAWQKRPDVRASAGRGGKGGDSRGNRRSLGRSPNNKKPKNGQKRMRDWREEEHAGNGQLHQPFPPNNRPWPIDPNSVPPCRLPQCKSINRQFHCSNDCYYHSDFGEQNRQKAQHKKKRVPPFRGNSMAGPDERFNNNGFFQEPPRYNGNSFEGGPLF